jgi:hypothetical protein
MRPSDLRGVLANEGDLVAGDGVADGFAIHSRPPGLGCAWVGNLDGD